MHKIYTASTVHSQIYFFLFTERVVKLSGIRIKPNRTKADMDKSPQEEVKVYGTRYESMRRR